MEEVSPGKSDLTGPGQQCSGGLLLRGTPRNTRAPGAARYTLLHGIGTHCADLWTCTPVKSSQPRLAFQQ